MDEKSDDDLFAEAVKDVKPLGPQNLARRPAVASVRSGSGPSKKDDLELDVAGVDEMSFVRGGIQKNVLRKLRNGRIRIEGELDLHGRTVVEAESLLRAFIDQSQVADRQRGVRIIHGKGLGSPDGKPVLKKNVREWLFHNDVVLACCKAGSAGGGSGAVHVLLRRK